MTSDDAHARTEHEADAGSDRARAAEPAQPDGLWLLRHKVELPDPIKGYVRRPEVEGRCGLTDCRLTAARAGRLRQDGPARPLLPGAAQTRPCGRLALARRRGRAGVGGDVSRPCLRARRRRDLFRPGLRAGRGRPCGGAGAGPGGGQRGRVPDQPAAPRPGAPRRAVRARARRSGAAQEPRGGRHAQRAASPGAAQPARGDGVPRAPPRSRHRHVRARRARSYGDGGGAAVLEARHLAVLRPAAVAAGAGGRGRRLGGLAAGAPHPAQRRPARGAGRRRRRRHGRRLDRDAAVARRLRRGSRLRAGHCALRAARPGPDRRGDRRRKRGTADRVDGSTCRAGVDRRRRRFGDAAASAAQGLLREATLRGGTGAVPGRPPRNRPGAGATRAGGRGAAPRREGGRHGAARPHRREHRRRQAVARTGS